MLPATGTAGGTDFQRPPAAAPYAPLKICFRGLGESSGTDLGHVQGGVEVLPH